MKHKKVKLNVLLIGFGIFGIQAQIVVPASGGQASGGGGSASYTVGQVVYTTNNGYSNGSVSQGVQQPYEISILTALDESNGITLSVATYPNPVIDFVNIIVKNFDYINLSYQLYDIKGTLLESQKLKGNQTSIATNKLMPASYFLKISNGSKEVKIFKIIKK
jgi:hypothetical protein